MPLLRRLLALAVLLGLLGCPYGAVAAASDPVGVWPLQPEPEVVRGFDPPDVVWGSGHRGVDLLGSPGQAVHAALAGTVTFAGVLAGRGVVVVDHGDTRTTYEPVTATLDRGVTVTPGAVIGTLETAGSHCPPRACLHWGWKRGEELPRPPPSGRRRCRPAASPLARRAPAGRGAPVRGAAPLGAILQPYASVLAAWSAYVLGRSPPPRPAGAPAGRPGAAGRW